MRPTSLAEFAADKAPLRRRCFAERLDPDIREQLDSAPSITHTTIREWLQQNGVEASVSIIGHHRRGQCRCARA
jgi:hypothetical protein